MTETTLGVLRMPDELFWADDSLHRMKVNSIRHVVADELERIWDLKENLTATLQWYEKNGRRCRLVTSGGEQARANLDRDAGALARHLLADLGLPQTAEERSEDEP